MRERVVSILYTNDEKESIHLTYLVDDESLAEILSILQDCEEVN